MNDRKDMMKKLYERFGSKRWTFKSYGEILKELGYDLGEEWFYTKEAHDLYDLAYQSREKAKQILKVIGNNDMNPEDVFDWVNWQVHRKGFVLIISNKDEIVINPSEPKELFRYLDKKVQNDIILCFNKFSGYKKYARLLSNDTKKLLGSPKVKNDFKRLTNGKKYDGD